MVAKKRLKVPRIILVYCEGKTEEAYFNTLFDYYRAPSFVEVAVYGQKGQHIALIDNTIAKRSELCAETGYNEGEIECWAVCDEDKMPCTYTELLKYAEDNDVHLAFSAPQFEMYLLQHFEQSGDTNKDAVFQKLGVQRRKFGFEGDYNDDTKADLDWMSEAIDQQPKIVKTAIVNSEIRNRTTKRPFFTVQELVKRIVELSL